MNQNCSTETWSHEPIYAEIKKVAIKLFTDADKIITADGIYDLLETSEQRSKKEDGGIDANQSGPIVTECRKSSINSVNSKKEILLNRKRKA